MSHANHSEPNELGRPQWRELGNALQQSKATQSIEVAPHVSPKSPGSHMGVGQNQKLVTRPGPTHATYPVTRHVTGARLARQALQYHEYFKSVIAVRQCATRGM